jgi:hypothetical protein
MKAGIVLNVTFRSLVRGWGPFHSLRAKLFDPMIINANATISITDNTEANAMTARIPDGLAAM